jgi:hypothetical protein
MWTAAERSTMQPDSHCSSSRNRCSKSSDTHMRYATCIQSSCYHEDTQQSLPGTCFPAARCLAAGPSHLVLQTALADHWCLASTAQAPMHLGATNYGCMTPKPHDVLLSGGMAHPGGSRLVPLLHAGVAVVQHQLHTPQQWLQVLAQAGVGLGQLTYTLQEWQQGLRGERRLCSAYPMMR